MKLLWMGLSVLSVLLIQDDLRKKLGDNDLSGEWVYDDINAGFGLARKTGKPMLVVFR
jgi:hypothetical protein